MSGLLGKKVLITRAMEQTASLQEELESRGAEPMVVPLLTFVKRENEENARLFEKIEDYDWVVLTSVNGVRFFVQLAKTYIGGLPASLHYAAVGRKTQIAMEEEGLHASFVPSSFTAEALVDEWLPALKEKEKVLYVRGNRSRRTLPEGMEAQRISFDSLTAYDTLIVEEHSPALLDLFHKEALHALTFFSPSQVEAFTGMIDGYLEAARRLPCFCIGPTTEEAAKEAGFVEVHTPSIYTAEALADEIEEYFTKKG